MKRTLTFFGLLLAGLSHAQPEAARLGPRTTQAILREQAGRGSAQKPTALAYRMTGYCRFDLEGGQFVDSTRYEYSGSRGTHFANEYENLLAGFSWSHSRPDRIINVEPPGQGANTEIAHTYDAANRITSSIYRMQGSTWKFDNTYNAAGLAVQSISSDSGVNGWRANSMTFYTYDAAGNPVFDSSAHLLTNRPVSTTRNHYTAGGKLDTSETRRWVGASTSYIAYRLVNAYDAAGRLSSATTYYANSGDPLEASERTDYTYNAASLLSTTVRSAFEDGVWETRDRDTVGYTGSGTLYTYLRQEGWDASAGIWIAFRQWDYQLDAQGRWSTELFQTRNSSGVLAPASKMVIDYNPAGLVTAATSYRYLAAQGSYDTNPSEQDRFHYESYQTTSVTPEPLAGMLLRAFPNPATAMLRIEAQGAAISRLELLTTTGQRIELPTSGAAMQQIDISAFPAGIYYLRAGFASGKTEQLRIVKL